MAQTATRPLWSLDLSFGAAYRNAAAGSLKEARRIVISDDDNLLVLWSFLHVNSSAGLLAAIDGSNGSITKSAALGDFPGAMMVGDGFEIVPLRANRFLLEIGDELRLGVSPELRWARIRTIPRKGKTVALRRSGRWSLRASPSGRTILFRQFDPDASYRVDPDSLATRDAPAMFAPGGWLTDGEIVANIPGRGGDAPGFVRCGSVFRRDHGKTTLRRLPGPRDLWT
ncbi:MAG TPA: hypothetical protein VGR73_00185 [Bryobacteraceae bacterium]|nr:hypothetical protein [Bryobacteraceae bacterium]